MTSLRPQDRQVKMEVVMGEWKEFRLNEIAQLEKNSWKVGDEELPYIALEHIVEGGLRLQGIGDSNTIASNKFRFNSDCFLFGKLRPYFRKLFRPNFEGICSTDIWVVKPKGENDKDFLFYFFANQEFVDFTYSGSSGTRMPRADWKFVGESKWNFPEPTEQKAIAEVLSSLDDKIDLLHRQNKTLEQMAETLFRQWFVEEAKVDWEDSVLPDEFDFIMGQSPKGSSFNKDGIGTPMYQGNADFDFRFPNRRVYTTEAKRLAQKFDTLISVRAPVGEQNMAVEECCIGRGVAAFKYKANSEYYTYTYFKMWSLMDEIKQFNNEGTVFGSISKTDFQSLSITIPPQNLVDKFQNEAKPIDDKVIENTIQIRTLEKMRDTLLPKLMSGEITIKK
ncbi:type I restriction modification DNA specificity domain protein [bacterium BMS3Abin03]|nr:type I restriction modification DNA specificity domain protein [bacterium BMS3Abin03]